ncbi:hypothetical protein AB3X91_14785 [Paraburkholderia sp. BR14263]|uniref:hypothetical protein n=1 Tax=unclassified Paraburkholderia TaxID=2615204 RepID=UPI0034CD886D
MTKHADFWGSDEPEIDRAGPHRRLHRKAYDRRLAAARSRRIAYGKGGGGSAPSPDPQIGKAALEEQQLGRDWLSFAKDQFDQGNVRQADLDSMTKQVTDQQLATQGQQMQWAQEDRDRSKNVFQPLQDDYIQQAKDYATPEKQEQAAAAAVADVQQQAKQANDANTRSMAAMGINPNSGRFQGITRGQETLNALNSAGAANNAREQTRQTGLAMEANAVNMGNGLPASASSAAGLGLNAGNSATGNAGAAMSNWRANAGIVSQGFGGAMQGISGGGSLLNQQYGNQLSAWQANQQASGASAAGLMGGVGSLVGTGIGLF